VALYVSGLVLLSLDWLANVQRLLSVVKMATVLEEYTTVSFWVKWLNTNDIHKEIIPVYGGKCLSCKGIHKCVANVSLMTKRLKRRCGCGWEYSQKTVWVFDTLVKRRDKCTNVGGVYMSRNKCLFPRFEYLMFYVLYPFENLFTDSPSYIYTHICVYTHAFLPYCPIYI
jgi:hypothetical protein